MKLIKSILSLFGFGAIAAANSTMLGGVGTPVTGQILAFGGNDNRDYAYKGTATFTGDGASLSATLNFIDGTAAIPYTPTSIFVCRTGGTDSSVGVPYSVVVDNKTATIKWTVAPANGLTSIITWIAFK